MRNALLRPLLNMGGFFVLALGLVAIYFGFLNSSVYVGGWSTPKEITLEELDASGSISSNHVTLTGYDFPIRYISNYSGEAWIPLRVQTEKGGSKPTEHPIILYVTNAEDKVEEPAGLDWIGTFTRFDEVTEREQLTGILTYGVPGSSGNQAQELGDIVRNGSIDDAITLQVDKPFPGFFESIPCMLAGVLLVGVSGVMWFFGSRL